jgi:uncharacterized protein (DUF362 family)/Pyruvate/2-oxoacid:ferredoxin oxidoreductase delta subunit
MKLATVSIVRCETYHEAEVLRGLRRSIDLLGGIETFVKRGDRVLLKPNLLYGKAPEKAVTTHPSVVRGMIEIVREAGGIPLIGDSPGMESLGRAAEKAGIKRVADEKGCPLVEFDRPIVPSERKGRWFKQLEVDRSVLEADVIINLPKWKTHGQVLLTLGVKNLFGCIPGPRKALWHLKAGQDQKLFARMLIDVYLTVRPALTVLDGIVGMDGNGPGSGRPVPLGLLLGAKDPLHLDQIVCDLLGIRRELLPTNRVAFESGIGNDEIKVVGENVEEAKIAGFQLPPLSDLGWSLPGFLKRALKKALTGRPVIDEEVCKICGRCEEICPPKALTQEGRLVLDEQKCIRCFCCQEICPEGAISIKPGWAQKLVRRKG